MKIKFYLMAIIAIFLLFACDQPKKSVTNEITDSVTVSEPIKPLKTFNHEVPEGVFLVVEEMPEFDGDLVKYLSENITYPDSAKINGIEGTVYILFIIEENGTISNIEVIEGVSEELDNEALRVIKEMPKWKAGKQDGETVRVQYAIPIKFKLS